MIRWISVKEKPLVNIKDDFDNRNNISERVLVYSKGHTTLYHNASFATYYHNANTWSVEGYRGGFTVTHWSYINKP